MMLKSLVAFAILAGASSAVSAQRPTTIAKNETGADVRTAEQLLARPVTVDIEHASVRRAIDMVAASAKVSIDYESHAVDVYTDPVSVHAKAVPLGAVLEQVLAGTRLRIIPLPEGKLALAAGDGVHAMDGGVSGTVTDAKTKQPLAGVTVTLDGATHGVVTDEHGHFHLTGVTAGAHQLTLRRLGYTKQVTHVTITDDATSTVAVTLERNVTVRLTDVVTTGAGEQRRLEVGNSITTLNVDSIMKTTPIRTVSDLLVGRVSGADVQRTSGTVGAGSRIRIRGQASLLANEDPIVIVDGMRYNAIYSSSVSGPNQPVAALNGAATGGGDVPASSRLDDIDPNTIESIDVLKGPAASALYGSDAANGVIVIKTKRGKAGPTHWSMSGDASRSNFSGTYADNYFGWGVDPYGFPVDFSCTLLIQTLGRCTLDSVSHFNPLNHHDTSPFTPGYSQRLNGQVSGGSDKVQYFVGMSYNNEDGDLTFPSALRASAITRMQAAGLPSFAEDPNLLNSISVSSNLSTQLSHGDIALSTNGIRQYHRDVPQGLSGFLAAGMQAPGYRDTLTNGWGTGSATTDFLTRNDEQLSHGFGSLSGNWRPLGQLALHASGGIDLSYNDQQSLLMQNYVLGANTSESNARRNQVTVFGKTVDASGTWTVPLSSRVQLSTTFGGQYRATSTSATNASGSGLPLGSTTYNDAMSTSLNEYDASDATAGWYLQAMTSFNQRLFVTVATRGDASSSFGSTAKPVNYPKFNASWLVSQEPFFPAIPGLSSLRLRAGYGRAGSQPPFSARFATYSFLSGVTNGAIGDILGINTIGNPNLLPEKSVEAEGGFDVGFGDDRVTVGMTLSHKTTQNALVNRTLPASFGSVIAQGSFGNALQQMQNIGKIFNSSFEIDATAHPIDQRMVNWTTSLSFSSQANRLVTLNTQIAPIYGGTFLASAVTRYVPGYPVDGLWTQQLLGYDDANHNGIIESTELRLSDSMVYVGRGAPSKILGWQNSVALWDGRLTIGGNFTYENNATQTNGLMQSQCVRGACIGAVDTAASLQQQILAAASSVSAWPFLETVSVFRFNEMSVSLALPTSAARALHAQNASVALQGMNLKVWSHYRGVDPDVNSNPTGDQITDAGALPQPRTWSIHVSLGF